MEKENSDVLQPSELEFLFEKRRNEDEAIRNHNQQVKADIRASLQQVNNALRELYVINQKVLIENDLPLELTVEDIETQKFTETVNKISMFKVKLGKALTKALQDKDTQLLQEFVHIFPEVSQLTNQMQQEQRIELESSTVQDANDYNFDFSRGGN